MSESERLLFDALVRPYLEAQGRMIIHFMIAFDGDYEDDPWRRSWFRRRLGT